MEIEREVKYSLQGPEDHRRLVGAGGLGVEHERERQENHYLDTPGLSLARSMAMLRLRRGSRGAVLTLKTGGELEAGYFQAVEVEAALSPAAAEEALREPGSIYRLDLPPVRDLRARFGEIPLRVAGVLLNERRRFRAGGFEVEVDRLILPDGSEEYEVEVETVDPGRVRAWLEAEFARRGVRAEPSRLTKFGRLLRWIESGGRR